MRWILFIAVLLTVAVIAPGCSGTLSRNKAPVFADLPSTSAPDNIDVDLEKMRPGDVIVITFAQPDGKNLPFSSKIQDDGTVTLLSNKVFIAAGKTAREFEKEVSNHYRQLFPFAVTDPPPIFVSGEVKAPGKRPFTGPITVLKAIESAGGFTEHANQRRVELIRADGQQLRVNCAKARREAQLDVAVFPSDRIIVPDAGGNARNPQALKSISAITLGIIVGASLTAQSSHCRHYKNGFLAESFPVVNYPVRNEGGMVS